MERKQVAEGVTGFEEVGAAAGDGALSQQVAVYRGAPGRTGSSPRASGAPPRAAVAPGVCPVTHHTEALTCVHGAGRVHVCEGLRRGEEAGQGPGSDPVLTLVLWLWGMA